MFPRNEQTKDWQVPQYSVEFSHPKQNRYCVCVFIINEGARIQAQLRKMAPLSNDIDIIIADGGSTDGSLTPELLTSTGVNTLLVKRGEGKLSAQMRMAFAHALSLGYEGIVVIDGNDKDDPAAIPLFIEALERGCDHIQGSRFIAGGKSENLPWLRWLGIRLLHAPLISLAARHCYTDTTNGFRAYSRHLLCDDRVAPFREVFSRYELHYYLAIRAARLGFAIAEVPVTRIYPSGSVPTKISPWRGNWLILRTLLAACLGCYNP